MSELGVALATPKRVLEGGHRLQIARNQSKRSSSTNQGENDADPPVPDVRCEHGASLTGGLASDSAVAVEVFPQAELKALQQARRQFVVARLASDRLFEFEVKLVGLLAVGAAIEVAVDVLARFLGEFSVEVGLEFFESFVAVSHVVSTGLIHQASLLGVGV